MATMPENRMARLPNLVALTIVAGTCFPMTAAAQTTGETDREAEMFGEEPSPPPTDAPKAEATPPGEPAGTDQPTGPVSPSPVGTPAPAGEARDETGLTAPAVTDRTVSERLLERYDTLDLGGLLYLRGEYAALERGRAEDFRLRTPNLLDAYLDARPSDRVRGYVRGRLYFDPTIAKGGETNSFGQTEERTTALLDQAWVKLDVGRTLFVTVGPQRIKWGAGRFWNPTDFVNQARLDPLAVLDERTGVSLVKLHLPVEALGWNFYAIADLEDASTPGEVGGALRAEVVVLDAEVALSAAARKDNPLRLGADLSTAVGDFDLRGEVALQHGQPAPFYEGPLGASRTVSREDDWIPQAVAGAEIAVPYSDRDNVVLGAEYFFNDAGYENADLYPLLLASGRYEPFYVGRHYGAAYALLQAPGNRDDHTFLLTTLGNLSDRSFVTRFDWRVLLLQYARLDAHVAGHYGDRGEFRLGFDLPGETVAQIFPGIPAGTVPPSVQVVPPSVEVGVGLQLDL
jgi:hypothetical protein